MPLRPIPTAAAVALLAALPLVTLAAQEREDRTDSDEEIQSSSPGSCGPQRAGGGCLDRVAIVLTIVAG